MINNYFDKVYVITCKESSDRQQYIIDHFKLHNIKFEFKCSVDKSYFLNQIDISQSEKSLLMTHLHCILDANLNRFDRILICEDDVEFVEDVNAKVSDFTHIIPKDWHFMHLGNQSWANIWRKQIKIKNNLYKFFEGVGSHCIGINNNIYGKCIDLFSEISLPVDILYWKLYKKYNCYCPENFIADSLSKNDHLGRNDEKCIFESLIHHRYYETLKKQGLL